MRDNEVEMWSLLMVKFDYVQVCFMVGNMAISCATGGNVAKEILVLRISYG